MTAGNRRETLAAVFASFDERDLPYVVLRGHEGLPGSDVDVFVDADAFDDGVAVCDRYLNRGESVLGGLLDLAAVVARNPRHTVASAVESPRGAVAFASKSLGASDFSGRNYVERSFTRGDLSVHLVNHLAYTSTLDRSKVRVDPAVETAMLDRRERSDDCFVPAPPDELAHLVCRGVFDYEGEFPERYEDRCDRLFSDVSACDGRNRQFRDLLSRLFYDADDLVYDLVAAGDYGSIRSRLRRYSDY